MIDLDNLHESILNGDMKSAGLLTREALEGGADPMELVTKCMVPVVDEVGR